MSPAWDRPVDPGATLYYDARARKWKKVRTVSVSGSSRFVYLRTRARGKYFRLVWETQRSRKAAPK